MDLSGRARTAVLTWVVAVAWLAAGPAAAAAVEPFPVTSEKSETEAPPAEAVTGAPAARPHRATPHPSPRPTPRAASRSDPRRIRAAGSASDGHFLRQRLLC